MSYNHLKIEKKWQDYWEANETFKTDIWDFSKPKYYALSMFPYPSGVGLHAGHPEGYTATDIVCRKRRMQGYNVLHPMGFDSFGLPAEQYAITTGNSPAEFTKVNTDNFRKQLKMLGLSYDWSREVSTSDPSYYKWTQWIFTQLYNDHLAKCVEMPVNWCEELNTVLANDEVIDGRSERGNYPVVKKNMKQWVIDIVAYAEKLLEGLEEIDWPESTKEMQRNWIGKSVGAQVTFKVADTNASFEVFTTRCDTLFGATYCVLAPEHPLVIEITTSSQKEEVEAYVKKSEQKSEMERTDATKEKTGVFTGAYAINPVNYEKMPIWISDYVLATYGTGAIMAVPAHDERDYAFAQKFKLPIVTVLANEQQEGAYTGDGLHINSGFLDGLHKEEAISKMLSFLEETGIGKKKINYKMREWIFARQRYWGEPIPIVYLDDGTIALPLSELPLLLPPITEYVGKNGQSPLARVTDWINVTINGKNGKRETSTMPGSAGSSWYFLRYIDPHNDDCIGNPELLKHWMPVDLYIGGPEHTVGHLLYARMWNHYLYDKGIVDTQEPFKRLFHQGMILGENGFKMGKRFPEYAVDVEAVLHEYGADTLRLYEMFMGPLEASKPWSNQGIKGSKKWLERVYRLFIEMNVLSDSNDHQLDYIYHETVKKVSEDIETLNLNTAISQMMIFINECYKQRTVYKEYALNFIKMLSCFAPHICEEMYQQLTGKETLTFETWPTYDESQLVVKQVEVVVQVNGKIRGKMHVETGLSQERLIEMGMQLESVLPYLESKTVVKTIVVKDKIVNIVVK